MREGWKYIKLTDVVWFQEGPGVRNTQYTENGVKLLNVANLVNGKIDLSTSKRYISEEEAYGKYRHFLVDEGDFIIASSGIQVEYFEKKMGFVDASQLPLCMNTSTIRFKTLNNKILDMRFFMYYLKSKDFKSQLSRQIVGIAQLNFGPTHLKKMEMPIISIEEQQRIVTELDLLSSIIEKQKAQLKELDTLAQSIFYDMFGDPVSNEKGWIITTIDSVCSSIVRGPFGSALKKDFFVCKDATTYKVYEQKHAIKKNSNLGSYYISKEKYEKLKRFEVLGGDIIMSCSGTIGELFQMPITLEQGVINQALLKFTLLNTIKAEFFLFAMEYIKKNFDTKGSGLQNIGSVKEIKKTTLSLPPLSLQQQFADKIQSIESQKSAITKSIAETQKLFDYTMDKYFR